MREGSSGTNGDAPDAQANATRPKRSDGGRPQQSESEQRPPPAAAVAAPQPASDGQSGEDSWESHARATGFLVPALAAVLRAQGSAPDVGGIDDTTQDASTAQPAPADLPAEVATPKPSGAEAEWRRSRGPERI
jgi:hypothetical protein